MVLPPIITGSPGGSPSVKADATAVAGRSTSFNLLDVSGALIPGRSNALAATGNEVAIMLNIDGGGRACLHQHHRVHLLAGLDRIGYALDLLHVAASGAPGHPYFRQGDTVVELPVRTFDPLEGAGWVVLGEIVADSARSDVRRSAAFAASPHAHRHRACYHPASLEPHQDACQA